MRALRSASVAPRPAFVPPLGFKPDTPPEKIVVALKRAIEKTFDAGKWKELAYLLGIAAAVENHPRLLRSLYWGDPDYPDNVFEVLRELAGPQFENLDRIADFVGVVPWLRDNDVWLYTDLCEESFEDELGEHVPLDQCEEIGGVYSIAELGRHAARIRSGLEDGSDPELAIGSAKELLESVLKTVTSDHDQKPTEDIPSLLKRAQKELDLDPKDVSGTLPGADAMRRTLSNLGQVVIGVAELRTLYGTGHGRSKSRELELAHARLVVNAAISVATFLIEAWQDKHS